MATSVRPILPDVYAEVRDGGLGIASGNLEGIQVKVGVASAGNIGEIVYLSSQRDAIQKFGSGPLVDACVDSFSSGAQIIYAVRANASVDGSIGGSYQLWIECTKPGECGVAQVHYSFDGGVKFGPKVTVPEDGKITISERALTIQVPKTQTFEVPSDDEEGEPRQEQRAVSLTGGDVWKFNVDTQTGAAVKFSANTVDITVTGKPIAVAKNGAGTGTLTIGGSPLIDADVIVEITASGGQNEATYRYSLDGGDNYSGNITVPEEETEIVGTGIMLTFSASGFEAGDTWVFSANAPQMSNGDMIEALELVNEASVEFEFIHVVGDATRATWAACQSMAEQMFREHRYTFFVCEARRRQVRETVDEWVSSLIAEKAKFTGNRVVCIPVRFEMVDMNSGYQVERNGAGILAGLISKTPVQRSVGNVEYNPLTLALELSPYPTFKISHTQALDAAGYTTARRYVGLSGIYITNGYTMAEDGSDFKELAYRRVMDKACKRVRTKLLKYLHGEADAAGIKHIQAMAESALMDMRTAGEISDFRVEVPGGQNILSTSELVLAIAIVPKGIIKWIKLEIGYENPAIRELINNAS